MKSIIIKIHSFIDVITNSSTEIYCNASSNAVDMVRNVITKVLEDAGSKKTFDDLYEVGFIAGERMSRAYEDNCNCEEEDCGCSGNFTEEECKEFEKQEFLNDKQIEKIKEYEVNREYPGDFLDLKVQAKGTEGENFISMFSFFDYDASNC